MVEWLNSGKAPKIRGLSSFVKRFVCHPEQSEGPAFRRAYALGGMFERQLEPYSIIQFFNHSFTQALLPRCLKLIARIPRNRRLRQRNIPQLNPQPTQVRQPTEVPLRTKIITHVVIVVLIEKFSL